MDDPDKIYVIEERHVDKIKAVVQRLIASATPEMRDLAQGLNTVANYALTYGKVAISDLRTTNKRLVERADDLWKTNKGLAEQVTLEADLAKENEELKATLKNVAMFHHVHDSQSAMEAICQQLGKEAVPTTGDLEARIRLLERVLSRIVTLAEVAEGAGVSSDNPDTCGVCHKHFAECEEDQCSHDDAPGAPKWPCCSGAQIRVALKGLEAAILACAAGPMARPFGLEENAKDARIKELETELWAARLANDSVKAGDIETLAYAVPLGTTVRLDYDDQIPDVVDKMNKALKPTGWTFKDDDQVHDGFIVLTLEVVPRKE